MPRAGAGSQINCSCVTKQLEKPLKGSPNGLGGFGWERGGWVALATGGLILGYLLSCTKAYELVVAVTPCLHFVVVFGCTSLPPPGVAIHATRTG